MVKVHPDEDCGSCSKPTSRLSEGLRSDCVSDNVFTDVANSQWFQNVTLVVIVLNALWIGIDTEWNHSSKKRSDGTLPLEPASSIIENLFSLYFSTELFVRFFGFPNVLDCVFDKWFVFDGCLVFFMVMETWVIPIIGAVTSAEGGGGLSAFSSFRLLRLLRLTRMARLMRAMPELLSLVNGMLKAMRAVSFILMFLVLAMYVFAIVFTSSLNDSGPKQDDPARRLQGQRRRLQGDGDGDGDGECEEDGDPLASWLFGSIGSSMMTLFTRGVLGDNLAETLVMIKVESLFLMWVFIAFMLISAITLLNMLIGILCDVITSSAREDDETMRRTQLQTSLQDAFEAIDTSRDGFISEAEWEGMKIDPEMCKALMTHFGLDVDAMNEHLGKVQDVLFSTDDKALKVKSVGMNIETFGDMFLDLRPDVPAGILNFKVMERKAMAESAKLEHDLTHMQNSLAKLKVLQAHSGANVQLHESPHMASLEAGTPRREDGHALAQLSLVKGDTAILRKAASMPKGPWLREIPTDVLFIVLRSRDLPDGCGGAKTINRFGARP